MLKRKLNNISKLILSCVLFLLLGNSLLATNPSIFDKINYQEVVEVTMEGDFSALKDNRRSGDAQEILLTFNDAKGQLQTWNIKVNLRGHFRRMRCDAMPPLKLNFKKSELKEAGLAKFDDMKLVTQCMEDTDDSKEALLKEYLAYKLYNEVTEESFRVQLLKVTYKDTKTNSTTKQWGFLIEDTAQLRNRIGAVKSKVERGLAATDFNKTSFYKMTIFQYLIGNNDYDISSGRNLKVVIKEGKYVAIPYDFDFSGLVNASYAVPNPNYGLTSIQDRNYMGFEEDLAHLDNTLDFFQAQKKVFKSTVKSFKILKGKYRYEVSKYVESFFENIDTITYIQKKTLIAAKAEAQID